MTRFGEVVSGETFLILKFKKEILVKNVYQPSWKSLRILTRIMLNCINEFNKSSEIYEMILCCSRLYYYILGETIVFNITIQIVEKIDINTLNLDLVFNWLMILSRIKMQVREKNIRLHKNCKNGILIRSQRGCEILFFPRDLLLLCI